MKHNTSKRKKEKRIFIGTIDIAGYYYYLARGLRSLNFNVTFFNKSDHRFKYKTDKNIFLLRLPRFAYKKRKKPGKNNNLKKAFWLGIEQLALFAVFIWAVIRHDVFIFGFGRSFINGGYDLWLLKKLNKTIISNVAHGSEARPPYINGAYQSNDGTMMPIAKLYKQTLITKRKIKRIEKESDYVICAPYTSHFLKNKFINALQLGVPFEFDSLGESSRDDGRYGGIHILHAPSHPAAKGSDFIRKTITRLKEKGHQINYVEINELPHKYVLNELKMCSFVVDQLYSDTAMATFATEAAWFGKPVVVGGYGLTKLCQFLDEDMFPPSHICHPDDLESAIESLIVDTEYRKSLGEKARDFVNAHWTQKQVANKYSRIISGDVPPEWFCDPDQVNYLHGSGLSEIKCKAVVREMIKTYGKKSLQLSHRPDLESKFVKFINTH